MATRWSSAGMTSATRCKPYCTGSRTWRNGYTTARNSSNKTTLCVSNYAVLSVSMDYNSLQMNSSPTRPLSNTNLGSPSPSSVILRSSNILDISTSRRISISSSGSFSSFVQCPFVNRSPGSSSLEILPKTIL